MYKLYFIVSIKLFNMINLNSCTVRSKTEPNQTIWVDKIFDQYFGLIWLGLNGFIFCPSLSINFERFFLNFFV